MAEISVESTDPQSSGPEEQNASEKVDLLDPTTSATATTLEVGANQSDPVAGPSQPNDTTKTTTSEVPSQEQPSEDKGIYFDKSGDRMADDFVVIEKRDMSEYKYRHLRKSFCQQIETFLKLQIERCDYYKKVFEQQNNPTMAAKFDAYQVGTVKHLEILKEYTIQDEKMPRFNFDHVNFNCVPTHVDVKEKEVQIVVKTADLPVANDKDVYVVAEFEFPHPKQEPLSSTIGRWLHYLRIDPKHMLCCSTAKSRQLDTIHAIDLTPFTNPESKLLEYNRPISFYVDKGKSRTLKRKFKPVKLTFYERRGIFKLDRKLGVTQVKIDGINDEITSIMRLPLMDGRRETEAIADIRVKVREPLVNKMIRAHEERMLVLY